MELHDYFKNLVIETMARSEDAFEPNALNWKPHEHIRDDINDEPTAMIANQPIIELTMSPSNDAKMIESQLIPVIRSMRTMAQTRKVGQDVPATRCCVHRFNGYPNRVTFQLYQWFTTRDVKGDEDDKAMVLIV